MPTTTRLCAGKITRPHGIHGQVRIFPYLTPENVALLTQAETKAGTPWNITHYSPQPDQTLIATIEGVRDRNAATAIQHQLLYIPRALLPVIAEEESFYHTDLLGLRVLLPSGELYGAIKAMHNYGAGDIVEIRCDDGAELFIPFDHHHFPAVHVAEGYVTYTPSPTS